MGFMDRMKQAREQAGEAMGNAGGVKGMVGNLGSMMPTAGDAAYAQLAQKLKAAGVEAPGSIVALRDTGGRDMGGGQKTEVDVTITPNGGDAYNTTVTQSFLPAQLEGLAVGGAITVKYDPDNPSAALIYGW